MKICLKIKIIFFLLIISLTEKIAYARNTYAHSRYYKNTEINIILKKPFTYVMHFDSYSTTSPPTKKGEFRFTEEQLSSQSQTIANIRYGLDFLPLWKAQFENRQLKVFTAFRKNETDIFIDSKPLAKYIFKRGNLQSYQERMEGTLFSEIFEYDFSGEKVIRQISLINQKTNAIKKFQFQKNQLEQVSSYRVNNSKENLIYYYKVNSVTSNRDFIYRNLSYFNQKNIEYKNLTEIYQSNQLLRVDFTNGYSIFYINGVDEKLVIEKANGKPKSITKTKYQISKENELPLFAKLNIFTLSQYEKINFAPQLSEIKYSWMSPAGWLSKETTFQYTSDEIGRIQKKLYPSDSYSLLLNDKGLVHRKNVYDRHFKLFSYYLYRYNDRNLLLEENLFDSQNDLQRKIKYFYDPTNTYVKKINHLSILSNDGRSTYFSHRGLEKDIKERILNRKVDYRHRPQSFNLRQRLLADLINAHKSQLKKIIYYNEKNDVYSYVRIYSKQDPITGITRLKIHHYDQSIDFNFKRKKDNNYYRHKFIKQETKSRENIDEYFIGRKQEFHHFTFDGVEKNPEINREPLKEIHSFNFDKNDVISFSKKILKSENGEIIKKEGISPDQAYFTREKNTSFQRITENFINGLIDDE